MSAKRRCAGFGKSRPRLTSFVVKPGCRSRAAVATAEPRIAASAGHARSHRKPRSNSGRTFAYYLLALSYAPDFCAQPAGNKDPRECGAGRHVGFVVHGLWPQSESGRGPERCEPARPVSEELIRVTLNYIPSESLIQHDWT